MIEVLLVMSTINTPAAPYNFHCNTSPSGFPLTLV